MQYSELRCLPMWCAGRNSKPDVVEVELDALREIELGGIAQAGGVVGSPVRRRNSKFTGIERVDFLAGAVCHLHDRMALVLTDAQHERRAWLGTWPGQVLREAAPNDFPGTRRRKPEGRRPRHQKRLSFAFIRPAG